MSDASFLIQVKVRRTWTTAFELASEETVRKFMPRLAAEFGTLIRALRADRDMITGEKVWLLFDCPPPVDDSPPSLSGLPDIDWHKHLDADVRQPGPTGYPSNDDYELEDEEEEYLEAGGMGSAGLPIRTYENGQFVEAAGQPLAVANQNELDFVVVEPRTENVRAFARNALGVTGAALNKAGALTKKGTVSTAKTTGTALLKAGSLTMKGAGATTKATGIASTFAAKTFVRFLQALGRGYLKLQSLTLAAANSLLVIPARKLFREAVALYRKVAAIENKKERLSALSSSTVGRRSTQWSLGIVSILLCLTYSYLGTLPGTLTLAVLTLFSLPIIRGAVEGLHSRLLYGWAGTAFGIFILASVFAIELSTPERRILNQDMNYFHANRTAIVNKAQAAFDREDYVAVYQMLERFIPAEDESIDALYRAAKPDAYKEMKRLSKVNAQFSFDGSNRYLTDHIVRKLKDPGSYEHVKTNYSDHYDFLEVQTTYRSRNTIGVLETHTVQAYLSLEGELIIR